jgi:hypothetical protein
MYERRNDYEDTELAYPVDRRTFIRCARTGRLRCDTSTLGLHRRTAEARSEIIFQWNRRWEGDTGTLDEHFTYSDGTKQRRVWTLKKIGDNRYTGTASDVIGEASGATGGNSFNWRYTLALPVDGSTYHVNFDDWMFMMDDKVMLNRAVMSKFGFRLGEITLSFRKREP